MADSIKIKCIIESHPSQQEYYGYPICSIDSVEDVVNLSMIVIPVYDYEKICGLIKRNIKNIWGIDQLIRASMGGTQDEV